MIERTIDQEKLNELMRNGWSYRYGSVSNGTFSTEIIVDPVTGKRYKLHVNNGKLTMTEVS